MKVGIKPPMCLKVDLKCTVRHVLSTQISTSYHTHFLLNECVLNISVQKLTSLNTI